VAALSSHAALQRLAERSAQRAGSPARRLDEALLAREVRDAGLDAGLVLPVVLRGSRQSLVQQLSSDSAALARLGNRDVTHFAVAVAAQGTNAVGIVLLSRLPVPIRTDLAPASLLARINQNRSARATPALAPDPLLARVAAATSTGFFEHPERDQASAVGQANEQLARQALRYGRVEALMVVIDELDEAAALEPVLSSDADAVGIGVAQGFRADTGSQSIAVTLVLGWSR
jgi:hypothetical protein